MSQKSAASSGVVAVESEMAESGFWSSAAQWCGMVGAPRTIGEVMEDVRTHRATHDREEGVEYERA